MVAPVQRGFGQAPTILRKAPLGSKQKLAINSMGRAVNEDCRDRSVDLMRPKDGLEAIKILLHTSQTDTFHSAGDHVLSTVFHKLVVQYIDANAVFNSNLCTDECFRDRFFGRLSGQHIKLSYSKFIEGTYPGALGEHHTTTKTLIRGKGDGRADQMLDWLELGVFDALERNVLASMRVTIFVEKPSPANVVEAYTYTFRYLTSTGGLPIGLAGMEVSGLSSKALAVADVQLGVIQIVRRLVLVDQTLPALPDNRFLNIQLFYTDDCPRNYEPLGFEKCVDWTIYFPKDERIKRDTLKIGRLDTGFHEVGLEVTALHCVGIDGDDPEERGELPLDLHYTNRIPGNEGSAVVGEASDTQLATQERVAADRVSALQRMALPHPFTQDSSLVDTQQPNSKLNLNEGAGTSPLVVTPPSLSQAKTLELRQHQAELLSSGRIAGQKMIRKGKPTLTPGGDVVRCQCDWNKDEGDMVHFSERRLLAPLTNRSNRGSDDQILAMMKLLCLIRRAFRIIDKDGYPTSNKDFAKQLHCDAKTATAVTARLVEEGFLTGSPVTSSTGSSQKGMAKYRAVITPDVMSRRAHQYLDPLVNIAQYYSVPAESTSLDYSLNFETLPAPPGASITACKQSTLRFSPAKHMTEPESSTTDDDELAPILSRTSSTRLADECAIPPRLNSKLSAAGEPATTDLSIDGDSTHASLDQAVSSSKRLRSAGTASRVLSRKRVKSSRVIKPIDVAFEQ
ncbi:MAG: DNA binding protein [Candelina mexicana]|nr:MAG: DNA binding protein [Candelina mexicana]